MKLKDIFLKLNNLGQITIMDSALNSVLETIDMNKDSISKKVFDYDVVQITSYLNKNSQDKLEVVVVRP